MRKMPRYERVKRVAGGGEGYVSLWRDTVKNEQFVVKEFKNEDMCMRERDTLTSFPEHENIIKLYHPEEALLLPQYGNPNLCLEYAPCCDILNFINTHRQGQPLTAGQLRSVATQLLEALQHLQNHNVIHKDIKPQNVLVFGVPSSPNSSSEDIMVKLTDFGIARHTDSTTLHFGSVPYMAPEQLGPSQEADVTEGSSGASDIWSLGATLTQLASGIVPWSDQVAFAGVRLAVHLRNGCGQEGFHPTIPSSLTVEFKDFLAKCFAAHPLNRGTCARLLEHPFITGQAKAQAQAGQPQSQQTTVQPAAQPRYGTVQEFVSAWRSQGCSDKTISEWLGYSGWNGSRDVNTVLAGRSRKVTRLLPANRQQQILHHAQPIPAMTPDACADPQAQPQAHFQAQAGHLTEVGEGALRGCPELTDVSFPHQGVSMGTGVSRDCPNLPVNRQNGDGNFSNSDGTTDENASSAIEADGSDDKPLIGHEKPRCEDNSAAGFLIRLTARSGAEYVVRVAALVDLDLDWYKHTTKKLEVLVAPDHQSRIPNGLFARWPHLEVADFSLWPHLAKIGDGALRGCPELTDVSFPHQGVSMGTGVLRDCPKLPVNQPIGPADLSVSSGNSKNQNGEDNEENLVAMPSPPPALRPQTEEQLTNARSLQTRPSELVRQVAEMQRLLNASAVCELEEENASLRQEVDRLRTQLSAGAPNKKKAEQQQPRLVELEQQELKDLFAQDMTEHLSDKHSLEQQELSQRALRTINGTVVSQIQGKLQLFEEYVLDFRRLMQKQDEVERRKLKLKFQRVGHPDTLRKIPTPRFDQLPPNSEWLVERRTVRHPKRKDEVSEVYVFHSPYKVRHRMFRRLVDSLLEAFPEAAIHAISGTHGDESGNTVDDDPKLAEGGYYLEDYLYLLSKTNNSFVQCESSYCDLYYPLQANFCIDISCHSSLDKKNCCEQNSFVIEKCSYCGVRQIPSADRVCVEITELSGDVFRHMVSDLAKLPVEKEQLLHLKLLEGPTGTSKPIHEIPPDFCAGCVNVKRVDISKCSHLRVISCGFLHGCYSCVELLFPEVDAARSSRGEPLFIGAYFLRGCSGLGIEHFRTYVAPILESGACAIANEGFMEGTNYRTMGSWMDKIFRASERAKGKERLEEDANQATNTAATALRFDTQPLRASSPLQDLENERLQGDDGAVSTIITTTTTATSIAPRNLYPTTTTTTTTSTLHHRPATSRQLQQQNRQLPQTEQQCLHTQPLSLPEADSFEPRPQQYPVKERLEEDEWLEEGEDVSFRQPQQQFPPPYTPQSAPGVD